MDYLLAVRILSVPNVERMHLLVLQREDTSTKITTLASNTNIKYKSLLRFSPPMLWYLVSNNSCSQQKLFYSSFALEFRIFWVSRPGGGKLTPWICVRGDSDLGKRGAHLVDFFCKEHEVVEHCRSNGCYEVHDASRKSKRRRPCDAALEIK